MDRKVLVVDDNKFSTKLLADILTDEGFIVFTADNGLAVQEMAHELKPDVILLDIMMPGMNGFEVCSLLKDTPDVKDIPVIMVSARTDGNDLKFALENGAFDYIKKPVDELELVARVQSAIRFKDQQDQWMECATKDGLTGIFNHSLLMELFEKELSRQRRNGGKIAFAMLDVDYFKLINDSYGHMAGDRILKEFSGILKQSVRQGDIIGRYGGEEFGVVISNLDRNGVLTLCERIRKKVEDSRFDVGSDSIGITASMGVFLLNANAGVTAAEMVKQADDALYRAKDKGRNRVELCEG